ncbi:MAG: helix-turn-helix transcriptional regulator [Clostridia bacterium]
MRDLACKLDCSVVEIASIERGNTNLSDELIGKIAKSFNAEKDDILTFNKEVTNYDFNKLDENTKLWQSIISKKDKS